ncbi:hypothetical protein Tco_1186111 [Tanacetum coccineum]
MTSFNQRECTGCGQPCDGFYCYLCTCPQCGVNLLLGTCLNCTYGDGKPVTCCGCEGPLRGGFCSFCASRDGNSFDYNPNLNSFDDSQNLSDYPPQPQYQTYSYGYDCPPQVPFVYNQNPCFDQNFDNNFPQTSPSFPQQYLCCENCGGSHATFQCQPMNQNLSNSNSSGFDQFQPPQYPVIHHSPQETSEEVLKAREDLMKAIYTFLRKFSRIPFGVTPKVLLIAWERFGEIKHAFTDEHYQQEDIQELMSKLLEDVRNISEELSEYINCPSWNRPIFYDDDDDEYTIIYRKPKAITPDLPIEEPDNSLIMGDEHLDTIPSVENLVPIPSEFEGISEDACDVPICEDPSTFDALNDHSEILSDSNDDDTSSDDNDFEDIEYVSLEEVNDVDQEENEFDLEDILQIQDVILHEKLLNISRLITNIESLNDNPTPDRVLKSPSLVPISVTDSNSFFEKSDTSFSFSDNSLPEFETFSDHTKETRSGSTTTHANNSLPEYESFLFEIKPDQGGLISIVISDNLNDPLLELPEFESFHFYPSFPRPLPEPPDVEISLNFEHDTPVINNFDELNEEECFDPGGGEIVVSQNVEDDDSFTFVIWIFLSFLTYPADSPLLLSTGSEDTIFDPGIST